MGDEVLKNTARILVAGARRADVVARVGGEEMLLLMPDTDEDAAVTLANRLRETLEKTPLQRDELVIIREELLVHTSKFFKHEAEKNYF